MAFPAGENSIGLSDLSKGEFELEVRATDENGPVSYTHLDVYKRQISDFTWQNNNDPSIPHEQRKYILKDGVVSVANFTACLLYTSRCV